nr:class C beta-lactamase [Massilia antarctica]
MTLSPNRTKSIAIAIAASCFAPINSHAADSDARIRAIVDKAIRPLMAEYKVPGMAVAVTLDGQPHVFNYGLASVKDNTPVGDATLFELGSISKTLTSTLASYAQVLGKLSLDEHPGTYMPELKGSPIDKMTVLNLGTYTGSGLPLQFPDEVTDATMTDYFRQWKTQAAAGAQRRYSNPSLGLFGHLTALALKSDFSDAMEQQLFPQLGMKTSYLRVPESAMVNYAWGYGDDNQARRMKPDALAAQAYGVRSTAADVLRFVQANIDPQQLDAPMRRAVEGTHVGYFKVGAMVQGLGWEQFPYPVTLQRLQAGNSSAMIMEPNAAKRLAVAPAAFAKTLFDKTGSTGGFGNYVAFVPGKKIGIVILANKNYPIPARVKAAYAILKQLAP